MAVVRNAGELCAPDLEAWEAGFGGRRFKKPNRDSRKFSAASLQTEVRQHLGFLAGGGSDEQFTES